MNIPQPKPISVHLPATTNVALITLRGRGRLCDGRFWPGRANCWAKERCSAFALESPIFTVVFVFTTYCPTVNEITALDFVLGGSAMCHLYVSFYAEHALVCYLHTEVWVTSTFGFIFNQPGKSSTIPKGARLV